MREHGLAWMRPLPHLAYFFFADQLCGAGQLAEMPQRDLRMGVVVHDLGSAHAIGRLKDRPRQSVGMHMV